MNRINRYHKNFWLKVTNTFEDSQTNQQKDSTSSKEELLCATHANFSRCRYQGNKKSHILSKNSKINPLVVKSDSDSNCKPFRKSAIGEKFNLKPKSQKKISF